MGEASDLDILVKLDERRKTFDTLMDIQFVLEDLFPETNVDLVLEDALKPAVRDRILSEARDVA
jgi:predicted nucleotidyltransferase